MYKKYKTERERELHLCDTHRLATAKVVGNSGNYFIDSMCAQIKMKSILLEQFWQTMSIIDRPSDN